MRIEFTTVQADTEHVLITHNELRLIFGHILTVDCNGNELITEKKLFAKMMITTVLVSRIKTIVKHSHSKEFLYSVAADIYCSLYSSGLSIRCI